MRSKSTPALRLPTSPYSSRLRMPTLANSGASSCSYKFPATHFKSGRRCRKPSIRTGSRSMPTKPPGAGTPWRSRRSRVKRPVAPINSHQSQRSLVRSPSCQSRKAASRKTRRLPSRQAILAGLSKASDWRSERAMVLCGPFFVDELDDLRHQLGRDNHDGLVLGPHCGLVFRNLFVFGLIVVVFGELADSLFIPSEGVLLFFLLDHLVLLRWRLRYARFALGVRS